MEVALNLLPADPGATPVPSGFRHVSGRGTRRGSAGRGTMAGGGSPGARPKGGHLRDARWRLSVVRFGGFLVMNWGANPNWLTWQDDWCISYVSDVHWCFGKRRKPSKLWNWNFGSNNNSRWNGETISLPQNSRTKRTNNSPLLSNYMMLEPQNKGCACFCFLDQSKGPKCNSRKENNYPWEQIHPIWDAR